MNYRLTLLALIVPLLLQGCESAKYYTQAIHGQLKILHARESIDSVLADVSIDEEVKSKLNLISDAKQFANVTLSLPTEDLYTSFVQLDSPYVVWNVFAALPFSISPKTWCYPVIGCLSYRGYFAEEDAIHYAAKLKRKGYEVFVGGISAYSTLGWFNDPILSSFLYRNDEQLAGLLFHELSHQLLYFDGDTTFNESFATTVELEGIKRYLNKPEQQTRYNNYLLTQHHRQQFITLMIDYRYKLNTLYQSTKSEAQMIAGKEQLFNELKTDYHAMSEHWPSSNNYTHWLNNQLNNAKLNTLATYHTLVKPLQQLLHQHRNDLPAFYNACLAMKEWDKQRRHDYLLSLNSGDLSINASSPK